MVPRHLLFDYLNRFDQLILGEKYLGRSAAISLQETHQNGLRFSGMEATALESICDRFNSEELIEWRICYASLTQSLMPSRNVKQQLSRVLEGTWWVTQNRILGYLSILVGLMDSLENRLQTTSTVCLETEIESSFIDQAKQLFDSQTESTFQCESATHSYDFVIVSIVGSVLERILQILCIHHFQQVPTRQSSAELMLDSCMLSLKNIGVLDHAIAAQINAWLKMRDLVLCGKTDHLNRAQVEDMIAGTRNFLDESLREIREEVCTA